MKIYCDGSCIGNPGIGGWAAIFVDNDNIIKKIYGFSHYTTNNRMELTAAIKALEKLETNQSVQIYTDSQYLKIGITLWIQSWKVTNWKNGKIKNIKFWQRLDTLYSLQKNMRWHWIKGHSGDKYNELSDQLAKNAAIKKITL